MTDCNRSRGLWGALIVAALLALGAPAAAQDCSNPAAACSDMLSADCAERYGAGAIGFDDEASGGADCATDMARYRGCLETVLRLCGGPAEGAEAAAPEASPTPTPTPTPAAPPPFDPTGRSYRVGVVTLTDIVFSPPPGSQILQNEQVRVTFKHDVCCNAETRIWVRSKTSGSCSMAGAGSPLFKGVGQGDGYVVSRSGPCEITGIVLQVKQENREQVDELTLPATYSIP